MPTQLSELTPQQRKDFRDKYDVFFFDKDGTVEHLDRKPIPGASEALALLESAGKKSILVTDTCIFTRNFLAKIIKPTFPQFTEENIMTSSSMLARHLKNIGFSKKIYVVGARDGIAQELINSGFDVECDTELEPLSFGEVMGIKLQKGIGAVVVSVDLNFTFRKLYKALNYLKDPECVLFASADFKVVSKNPIIPGPGALVMPLVEITGKEMQWCSKSSAVAVEVIKGLGYDMNRCLFVGDGMENDIVCGNNCGMDTLLVTSGFSTKADLERAIEKNNTKFIPTYVADSVAELGEIYRT